MHKLSTPRAARVVKIAEQLTGKATDIPDMEEKVIAMMMC
jgi:hypothetical protein